MDRELKALRAKHSLTQKDMANLLKISETSYRQKENMDRQFTLGEAKAIADIFNRTIESIFFAKGVYRKETKEDINE